MNKVFLTFIILILAVIFLAVGFGAGVFYQQKKDEIKLGAIVSWQNLLNSKVTSASKIYATGEVTKISGRMLTLTSNGESLDVPVSNNAKIVEYILSGSQQNSNSTVPAQREINISSITIGNRANIELQIGSDGQFSGVVVTVIPTL